MVVLGMEPKTLKTTDPGGKKDVGLRAPKISIIHCARSGCPSEQPLWIERSLVSFCSLDGDADKPLCSKRMRWWICEDGVRGRRYESQRVVEKWFMKFCRNENPKLLHLYSLEFPRAKFWRTYDIFPSGMWWYS